MGFNEVRDDDDDAAVDDDDAVADDDKARFEDMMEQFDISVTSQLKRKPCRGALCGEQHVQCQARRNDVIAGHDRNCIVIRACAQNDNDIWLAMRLCH